ncbi:MAG: hypothetical protein SGJ20_05990, partial [Planctomycetota bacterium]|nr:hypothetical protein [Planctomycetota bacterium]
MKHPQISSIQCSSTNSQGAPRHRLLWTMIVALLSAFALDHREPQLQAAELPAVSDKAPIPGPHFPNSVYAVVFRNWGLATPERLAKVLKTTPEKVTAIATSMGLPKIMPVPAQMDERGYVTLIRRNWHLLPFDQMVTLLNIAAEELELRLREDDFLWIKLGRLKPNSPPVVYREPDAAAKKRAAEIKSLIHKHFGDKLAQPGEERFKFVTDLSRVDPKPEPKKSNDNQPAAKTAAKDEPPRIVYSYFALFGDPLSNPKVDPFPDGLLQKLQARGVNGVWLHVVLRQLVTGGKTFPEFGEGHEARLENLRKLVERADKFGIKIYLY